MVVGGGEVALRKVRLVHQAGARITVVAKDTFIVRKIINRGFGYYYAVIK